MDRIIEKTIKNLEKHYFKVKLFNSIKEIENEILLHLKQANTFAFGGSTTLVQTGLKDFIIKNGETYIERISNSEETKLESERKALQSDLYFAGINAISSTGSIIEIDKRGNRTGAILFGPKKVILISSTKKICETENEAISRAKNIAAVKNCERFNLNTPCRETLTCSDCEHKDNICYSTIIVKRSYPHYRIHIFLINEDYGF